MEAHAFLVALTIVLGVAAVTTVVFQRLRQPVVLGYILAGLIVGPHVPIPLVADREIVQTLSELGVILLMFSLGLEFSLRKLLAARAHRRAHRADPVQPHALARLRRRAAASAGRTLESLFTGAIIAISSTTIIAKAFDEQGVTRHAARARGRRPDRRGPDRHPADGDAHGDRVGRRALRAASSPRRPARLALFLVGARGGRAAASCRAACARSAGSAAPRPRSSPASGFCFGVALLAHAFGYSVALGAFIAGSLVAESGEAEDDRAPGRSRCATCSPRSSSCRSAC